jgi:hypothetical protein
MSTRYIPAKSIGNKSRLPWVNNQLKKLINKKNKLYKKKKRNPKYKEQYQETKTKLQNEMRNNCLLSIFAFSGGFEFRVPSLRRGAMLVFSYFWLFM